MDSSSLFLSTVLTLLIFVIWIKRFVIQFNLSLTFQGMQTVLEIALDPGSATKSQTDVKNLMEKGNQMSDSFRQIDSWDLPPKLSRSLKTGLENGYFNTSKDMSYWFDVLFLNYFVLIDILDIFECSN